MPKFCPVEGYTRGLAGAGVQDVGADLSREEVLVESVYSRLCCCCKHPCAAADLNSMLSLCPRHRRDSGRHNLVVVQRGGIWGLALIKEHSTTPNPHLRNPHYYSSQDMQPFVYLR